jgi:hypothetical protein
MWILIKLYVVMRDVGIGSLAPNAARRREKSWLCRAKYAKISGSSIQEKIVSCCLMAKR